MANVQSLNDEGISRGMTFMSGKLSDLRSLTIGLIGVTILLQIHLIFVQGVNWDEFLYLSKIYELHDGTLRLSVQTIHTRLFAWLPLVPGGEIAQFRIARFFMLGCELVSMACIIAIARRFVSRDTALLLGLLYVSGGFVFYHGFSFRADPMAAAMLMSASWLILRPRLTLAVQLLSAFLIALAAMVTIKSVFYAPVLIGLGLMRVMQSDRPKAELVRLATVALVSLPLLVAMYVAHDAFLPSADIEHAGKMLGEAASVTLFSELFPKGGYVIAQMAFAPVLALTVFVGLFVLVRSIRVNGWNAANIGLTGLALPLSTLIFYHNSYPYYYAFLMPPVVIACAAGLDWMLERYGHKFIMMALFANLAFLYWNMGKEAQSTQADVVAAAHEIFPEPVPYIDGVSMIAGFPKAGFFMSAWRTNHYEAAGEPIFEEIIRKEKPVLLVANHPYLVSAVEGEKSEESLFLDEDVDVLSENYINHWGPLWVAGKSVQVTAVPQEIEILIAGSYTIESGFAVELNGESYKPGTVVRLKSGKTKIAALQAGAVRLRWGDNLKKPTEPWIAKPLYVDFTG